MSAYHLLYFSSLVSSRCNLIRQHVATGCQKKKKEEKAGEQIRWSIVL